MDIGSHPEIEDEGIESSKDRLKSQKSSLDAGSWKLKKLRSKAEPPLHLSPPPAVTGYWDSEQFPSRNDSFPAIFQPYILLHPGSSAADIGGGSGLITEELLEHDVKVVEVMRNSACESATVLLPLGYHGRHLEGITVKTHRFDSPYLCRNSSRQIERALLLQRGKIEGAGVRDKGGTCFSKVRGALIIRSHANGHELFDFISRRRRAAAHIRLVLMNGWQLILQPTGS
jgi:hypothetical protein